MALPRLSLEAVDGTFGARGESAEEPELAEELHRAPDLGRLAFLARRGVPSDRDNPTARELRMRYRELVERLEREAGSPAEEPQRFRFSRDDGDFEVLVRHGSREERLRLTVSDALEHEIRQELTIGSSRAVMSFREQFSGPPEEPADVVFQYRASSRSGAQAAQFRAVVLRSDGSTVITTNENGRVESYIEDPSS